MATVATYMSHTSKALNFYFNTKNLMFAIGRTSPWGTKVGESEYTESNYPLPSLDTTDLTEIIGYKRYTDMFFVVPDDNGTYVVDGVKWKKVVPTVINSDPTEAKKELINLVKTEKSRWLYISTILESVDFTGYTYRQLGLYSDLTIDYTSGATDNKNVYLANEIISESGILEVYQNRVMIARTSDQRELIAIVLEF